MHHNYIEYYYYYYYYYHFYHSRFHQKQTKKTKKEKKIIILAHVMMIVKNVFIIAVAVPVHVFVAYIVKSISILIQPLRPHQYLDSYNNTKYNNPNNNHSHIKFTIHYYYIYF